MKTCVVVSAYVDSCLFGHSQFKPAQRGNVCISACDREVGQNALLRGKFIPVTHCDNNLLQVGAGG